MQHQLYLRTYIYIYKEELKTVVCELLACTQPNHHDTFTVFWNTYRRVSLRERRAQIDFSWEVRDENPENDCLVLRRKYTDFHFQQHCNNTTLHLPKAGCLC